MKIMNTLRSIVVRLLGFLSTFLSFFIGKFSFSPPPWMRWLGKNLGAKLLNTFQKISRIERRYKLIAVAGILIVAVAAERGYRYYKSRPVPQYVSAAITEITPTQFYENAKPDNLVITFSESAAPLEMVNKAVASGIKLTPNFSGSWKWQGDRILIFTPKDDWPIDKVITVQLDKKTLSENALLETYTLTTQTRVFSIRSASPEFYQDPRDPLIKRALLNLHFSHAVDLESLKQKLFVEFGDSKKGVLGIGKKSFPFRLIPNKYLNEVVVETDPIQIPDEEKTLTFNLETGIRAKLGGETKEAEEKEVKVPGMFSYFQVNSAKVDFAENQTFEMEQVLAFNFSTDVTSAEIAKNLKVYLLPEQNPDKPKEDDLFEWSEGHVNESILKKSKLVKVDVMPTQHDSANSLIAKFSVPPQRFIYVEIAKGSKSFGGYVLSHEFTSVQKIPDFPKRVSIMTKGSLLSLAGEKKISIAVRDVPNVRMKFSRVLPQDLNNFVTQTSGDFAKRTFNNYYFNEDNLTEIFDDIRTFNTEEHGKTQYTSVDFGKFLPSGKNGLFVFRSEEWLPESKRPGDLNDQRIILVTNLGLLLKKAQDGTFHVFVQNTHTGSPVSGATIEILGKNGLPVFSKVSDASGHVVTPILKDFKNEKTPVAVVAKTSNDYSFIPFESYDRALNLSRFDIGGVSTEIDPQHLESFVFSDRGIYRPGDDIHIGVVTKPYSWKQNVTGAPLMFIIRDPRGNEIFRSKFSVSNSGLDAFDYKTEESSTTGTYDIQVYTIKEETKPENLIGSTTIRVEEFMPDRLRISTKFSLPQTDGWLQPKDLKGHVSLVNLFGSPAQERRVQGSIGLKPANPYFKKYADYQFFDPFKTQQSFTESLAEKKTDASGNTEFDLPVGNFAKGIYQLTFVAEGFEAEAGRGVVSLAKTTVSPLDFLVGIKADGNLAYIRHKDQRSVNLIAVDPNLAKKDVSGLNVQIVEQKYVSVLMKSSGVYRYESILKEEIKKSEKVNLPKDGLNYQLPTSDVGNFTLVIRDAQDVVLNRKGFSVIGPGDVSMNIEKNAELQIKIPKSDYKPGETVELQVIAPYLGAGVITVERENVFQSSWFKATTTSSVQKIKIPENLEGNAYIYVSFLRAIDSKEIYMSPLSYAVAPITISRSARANKIEISTPEKIEPGQTIAIKYRAESPTDMVLYGVDEGILQVAKYRTPEPLDFFFRKRALTTETWQILDLLIAEFSVQQSLSAPGGSEDALLGKNLNPFKRKSLKPVAFWSGILEATTTDQTYSYAVPDYFNGSLKVMAVAVSKDKVGTFEKSNIVKGPFVLSPNVPTFVAPGDSFKISVGISNQLPTEQPVDIKVSLAPSKHFSVEGNKTQTVQLKGTGNESALTFDVKATEDLGAGEFIFNAEGAGKVAKGTAFLSVRPSAPFRVTTNSGSTTSSKKDLELDRRIYSEFGTNRASMGAVPLAFADGLATYVENFEHLCTEQLVSRGWLLFTLKQIPELQRDPKKTEEAVLRALRTLAARQNSGGAFGFWAANSYYSNFQNIYSAHFMTDLADAGYAIPDSVRERSLRFLNEIVAMPDASIASLRDVSYGLYVLARNNILHRDLVQETLKRVQKKNPKHWKSDLSTAYLAATYALMKNAGEADKLADNVDFISDESEDYDNFYDSLRRNSQVLYLFSKHFPNRVKVMKPSVLEDLAKTIMKGSYNTLTSAYTTIALYEYSKVQISNEPLKISVLAFDDKNQSTPVPLKNKIFPIADLSIATKKIQIGNENSFPIFYQLIQSGFDSTLPDKPLSKGIEIFREFTNMDGKPVTSVKVGDKLDVHIRVRTLKKNTYVSNVSVIDLLPGGFEVELNPMKNNTPQQAEEAPQEEGSFGGDGEEDSPPPPSSNRSNSYGVNPIILALVYPGTTWQVEYADVREDRVNVYGTVGPTLQEFIYRVRATAEGKFKVPPAFADSMYNREVQAMSKGDSISVEKP